MWIAFRVGLPPPLPHVVVLCVASPQPPNGNTSHHNITQFDINHWLMLNHFLFIPFSCAYSTYRHSFIQEQDDVTCTKTYLRKIQFQLNWHEIQL